VGPTTHRPACETFRADCDELWRSLPEHPFLKELQAGTLPLERFRFFLEQDIEFLKAMVKAVGVALARARDETEMRLWIDKAALIVERELENERALLASVEEQTGRPEGPVIQAPATVAYGGWLVSVAVRGEPIDLLVAAHPCMWSYAEIAVELERDLVAHPIYGDWVRFFAGEEYTSSVQARSAALDELLAPLPESRIAELSELFTMGTRLEVLFWDMAHGSKHWPDLDGDGEVT
jgi:thiaminase/transcriptional activator TenA